MIESWEDVRKDVFEAAAAERLLPFFGAALSQYKPTSLPLGNGLLRAALDGAFGDVFPKWPLSPDAQERYNKTIANRSAEVILQGLAEGLLDRSKLAMFYNRMLGSRPNPLHFMAINALRQRKLPAVFTTNEDSCLEAAMLEVGCDLELIYDEEGFAKGLRPGVFQFHGAIGGETSDEIQRRRRSLTFTLNSMGPRLPGAKGTVLEAALRDSTLFFVGYGGSDPDIWYTVHDWLPNPDTVVYWCVRSSVEPPSCSTRKPPWYRLRADYPESIKVFSGDIVQILGELGAWWGLSPIPPATIDKDEQNDRLSSLRDWIPELRLEERELAFGWLLVSVGLHKLASERLTKLICTLDLHKEHDRHLHMMASLFAGFAHREMSEHRQARQLLEAVTAKGERPDDAHYVQAVHKLGESLSAFESMRFWHWWPTHTFLHSGARMLERAIQMYGSLPAEELSAKQLSRTGVGNAFMNLGQLYRRVAAVTPGFRHGLVIKTQDLLAKSRDTLEQEGDMRSLAMVTAALGADDPAICQRCPSRTRHRATVDAAFGTQDPLPCKKLQELERSIDISVQWNQDDIQIGSAYFAKAHFLAKRSCGQTKSEDLEESERCYCSALAAFREAEMKAEIVRTQLDLASLLMRQAHRTMLVTQSSWEWEFLLRTFGVAKAVRALFLREMVLVALLWLIVLIMVDLMIDLRAVLSVLISIVVTGLLAALYIIVQSFLRR